VGKIECTIPLSTFGIIGRKGSGGGGGYISEKVSAKENIPRKRGSMKSIAKARKRVRSGSICQHMLKKGRDRDLRRGQKKGGDQKSNGRAGGQG